MTSKKEKWRPCDRVGKALARLSRDRWLSGEEVKRTAVSLARCVSGNPWIVAAAACPIECTVVGMLRGEPPARRWDGDYGRYVHVLGAIKNEKSNSAELAILNLVVKGMAHGY